MRVLLQRVQEGRVEIDGALQAKIGPGLVILVGIAKGDSPEQARALGRKTARLRIFSDDAGKLNLSLADIGGEALVISQFTLYADCNKGLRPSFEPAAPPALAEELYLIYQEALRQEGIQVKSGVFQANMQVGLVNDGPVTILLEK